ncbi:CRISPR-associated protein Csm4 [Thermosyntropha lipolytica DSM 11003]|uniref:CRISPR system Cms protein Csm4 n=1 Tax=Thermosyntropha lipolytica DSM 11003 TaxID=1123382 RepID=A0A1M5RLH8_9FIRM|nr:type III-A CRISPR-associated RAMP protein Csm4 [Thermosyntropha lipolytica]SHH26918.1 CRISPR-associated protein Csm4 [Thermosyntropha lipolytica DSM 11003]
MFFYYFKLQFHAPVHFGADIPALGLEKTVMACHADTFFSALYIEALKCGGEEKARMLYEDAKSGRFLLSDLMPYAEDILYIPRPLYPETPGKSDIKNRKKIKKMDYIPAGGLKDYFGYLRGKRESLPDDGIWSPFFGVYDLRVRVALNYQSQPQPYYVGTFSFAPRCGLYFILGIDKEDRLPFYTALINSLGYSGIGGKRTSGWGWFELEDDPYELEEDYCLNEHDYTIASLLKKEQAAWYLNLSVTYPRQEELGDDLLEKSYYRLIRREGFVQSPAYNDFFVKRRPLIMFAGGSLFPRRLQGDIPDVSLSGRHPVYRYGKSLMLGVDFDDD